MKIFAHSRKFLCGFISIVFCISSLGGVGPAVAQTVPILPGQMIALSSSYSPVLLKGLKVNPDNPFQFDFIVADSVRHQSYSGLVGESLKDESTKLVRYFLAALTIPESDMWVNLSPHESDRIIPRGFGQTEMGRDLLTQDYLLKQLTASLLYPEGKMGEAFWSKIHAQTGGAYEIPTEMLSKIWIVPEKAVVYEGDGVAYVIESRLKVMLEEEYAPLRETILPAIENEVNDGKHFAQLRQIYSAFILASWYKQKLKSSILAQVYADSNKIEGVNHNQEGVIDDIYARYVEAFKEGVYDYIKDEYNAITQDVIPRKYFSGGFTAMGFSNEAMTIIRNPTQALATLRKTLASVAAGIFLITADITPVNAQDLTGKDVQIERNIDETLDSEVQKLVRRYEIKLKWFDDMPEWHKFLEAEGVRLDAVGFAYQSLREIYFFRYRGANGELDPEVNYRTVYHEILHIAHKELGDEQLAKEFEGLRKLIQSKGDKKTLALLDAARDYLYLYYNHPSGEIIYEFMNGFRTRSDVKKALEDIRDADLQEAFDLLRSQKFLPEKQLEKVEEVDKEGDLAGFGKEEKDLKAEVIPLETQKAFDAILSEPDDKPLTDEEKKTLKQHVKELADLRPRQMALAQSEVFAFLLSGAYPKKDVDPKQKKQRVIFDGHQLALRTIIVPLRLRVYENVDFRLYFMKHLSFYGLPIPTMLTELQDAQRKESRAKSLQKDDASEAMVAVNFLPFDYTTDQNVIPEDKPLIPEETLQKAIEDFFNQRDAQNTQALLDDSFDDPYTPEEVTNLTIDQFQRGYHYFVIRGDIAVNDTETRSFVLMAPTHTGQASELIREDFDNLTHYNERHPSLFPRPLLMDSVELQGTSNDGQQSINMFAVEYQGDFVEMALYRDQASGRAHFVANPFRRDTDEAGKKHFVPRDESTQNVLSRVVNHMVDVAEFDTSNDTVTFIDDVVLDAGDFMVNIIGKRDFQLKWITIRSVSRDKSINEFLDYLLRSHLFDPIYYGGFNIADVIDAIKVALIRKFGDKNGEAYFVKWVTAYEQWLTNHHQEIINFSRFLKLNDGQPPEYFQSWLTAEVERPNSRYRYLSESTTEKAGVQSYVEQGERSDDFVAFVDTQEKASEVVLGVVQEAIETPKPKNDPKAENKASVFYSAAPRLSIDGSSPAPQFDPEKRSQIKVRVLVEDETHFQQIVATLKHLGYELGNITRSTLEFASEEFAAANSLPELIIYTGSNPAWDVEEWRALVDNLYPRSEAVFVGLDSNVEDHDIFYLMRHIEFTLRVFPHLQRKRKVEAPSVGSSAVQDASPAMSSRMKQLEKEMIDVLVGEDRFKFFKAFKFLNKKKDPDEIHRVLQDVFRQRNWEVRIEEGEYGAKLVSVYYIRWIPKKGYEKKEEEVVYSFQYNEQSHAIWVRHKVTKNLGLDLAAYLATLWWATNPDLRKSLAGKKVFTSDHEFTFRNMGRLFSTVGVFDRLPNYLEYIGKYFEIGTYPVWEKDDKRVIHFLWIAEQLASLETEEVRKGWAAFTALAPNQRVRHFIVDKALYKRRLKIGKRHIEGDPNRFEIIVEKANLRGGIVRDPDEDPEYAIRRSIGFHDRGGGHFTVTHVETSDWPQEQHLFAMMLAWTITLPINKLSGNFDFKQISFGGQPFRLGLANNQADLFLEMANAAMTASSTEKADAAMAEVEDEKAVETLRDRLKAMRHAFWKERDEVARLKATYTRRTKFETKKRLLGTNDEGVRRHGRKVERLANEVAGFAQELDKKGFLKGSLDSKDRAFLEEAIKALSEASARRRELIETMYEVMPSKQDELKKRQEKGKVVDAGMGDTVGGIKLDSSQMDFEVRGEGGVDCLENPSHKSCLQLNFSPEQIQRMRENIMGFTPVIINIQPIPNLPLFLGLDDVEAEEEVVKLSLLNRSKELKRMFYSQHKSRVGLFLARRRI